MYKLGFQSSSSVVAAGLFFFNGNTQLATPAPLTPSFMTGGSSDYSYIELPNAFYFVRIRIVTESPNISIDTITLSVQNSNGTWSDLNAVFDVDANRDLYILPTENNSLAPNYYQNHALIIDIDTAFILSSMTSALTPAHQLLFDALTSAQQAVIATLPLDQQVTMLSGTTAQKNAIISTLTPEQQSAFTTTPVEFIQTPEQIASDKLTIEQIKFKLKSGEFINDDDSVMLVLMNSAMATASMQVVDAGGGYNGLRSIGLTDTQSLRVLAIYNVKMDTNKYLSEVKLETLRTNPDLMPSLVAYLSGLNPPLELPSLVPYIASVRSDFAVYSAIKNWNGA